MSNDFSKNKVKNKRNTFAKNEKLNIHKEISIFDTQLVLVTNFCRLKTVDLLLIKLFSDSGSVEIHKVIDCFQLPQMAFLKREGNSSGEGTAFWS